MEKEEALKRGAGTPQSDAAESKKAVYSARIQKYRSKRESMIDLRVRSDQTFSKQTVRELYPDVCSKLFDQSFKMFDWDATGAEAASNIKMFSILMVSLCEMEKADMIDTASFFDVAFSVFDADESGALEKDEFTSMVYAMLTSRTSALKLFISSRSGREILGNYAMREHSGENIHFLVDVDTWKSSKDVTLGVSIVQSYIGDSSVTPVNLSSKCVKTCLTAFESAGGEQATSLPDGLFDKCEAEILRMIERDTFARFNMDKEQVESLIEKLFAEVDSSETGKIEKAEYLLWARKNPEAIDFYNRLIGIVRKLKPQ